MLALLVSLQVKPGHRDAFLAAITENAKRSFADEPGCLQFDVAVDNTDDRTYWITTPAGGQPDTRGD